MKVKEIIKAVDNYNRIADLLGKDRIALKCYIGEIAPLRIEVKDEKSFRKEIRKEIIEPLADEILNGEYELNEEKKVKAEWFDGYKFTETITFWAE